MKVVVFGSTGNIGMKVIEKAMTSDYEFFAFTRSPEKLDFLVQQNLHIVRGNVLNANDVDDAVEGMDAVIIALGDGFKGNIRCEGTKNILFSMEKHNVKRLVCMSTFGIGESKKYLNFFWKNIMFGFFLKKAYEDHIMQESIIKDSNLNYTIVRPSGFADNEQLGFHIVDKNFTGKLKLQISKADVANFLFNQINDNKYERKAVNISA